MQVNGSIEAMFYLLIVFTLACAGFLLFIIIILHYDIKGKELEVRYCGHCGKTISGKKIGFWRRYIMKKYSQEDMRHEQEYFKYCHRCGAKNQSEAN
ncbi:MAG: hypothetical protein ACFFBD_09565, partial [Candidatus Hodarchaeota archaeon]